MKLIVYKGFEIEFLEHLADKPLIDEPIIKKKDVLQFDKKTRKNLSMALLSLDEGDSAWITYEEYSLIKNRVDDAIEEDGLNLTIFRNNLYPDYYPVEFEMSEELAREIIDTLNGDRSTQSDDCLNFIAVYNALVDADGVLYGSFHNYEYDNSENIIVVDYYPQNLVIEDVGDESDYNIFLNEDVDTYLRDLERIIDSEPKVISLKATNGETSQRIQRSLQAYCLHNGIRLINFNEKLPEDVELENELIDIAKNDIKIKNFESFRTIKFYKNPDIDKEVVDLSQAQIIQEIIRQAENSYDEGARFRDIFVTASTGAGKSVMFQVPAVYLAKKYQKLTVIIEPVKALMQDQKEKLHNSGYKRVEAFNSDLITQIEKEAVLQRIKDGEVDLLYLSPETLLSYSIETIIGDREIGLVIVDEAHIVTTWGVGFRPDYWYLGIYLNKLRNRINVTIKKAMERKIYHFPICAFTATAINGDIDDTVSDTVVSLYMENPIKYLGYVRRDDIGFEITHPGSGEKLPKSQYEFEKCKSLDARIKFWLSENEKTIVYFPYASLVFNAAKGVKEFAEITIDKRIGTYTGKKTDEQSNEAFNETKRQTFDAFRKGSTPIMLATKAFGMGVDVNDVKNVYHYAASGNLSDYVQEIGRAARKSSMKGKAITDFYYDDMKFMKALFGMSQIKQYQVKKVLEGIYDTYKSKKGSRNFLISPESFTYIFSGKKEECINKLKTCLLMLEKDFYDTCNNVKVLISRPQSIFTKAFICVNKESEKDVLNSEFGKYMKLVAQGRFEEKLPDGTLLSDCGDIYALDLKGVWETYYPNISFPQFKKILVNGEGETELFTYLKSKQGFKGFLRNSKESLFMEKLVEKADPQYQLNDDIKWNFTKFLVDREGNVVQRYESTVEPKKIAGDIEKLL